MPRYEHIFFVCNNAGKQGDTKLRCAGRGADALLERLKACVVASGRKGRVRVSRSGCLDMCAKGCAAVAYSRRQGEAHPEETWYSRLGPNDAEALFAAHVERGERYVPVDAATATGGVADEP